MKKIPILVIIAILIGLPAMAVFLIWQDVAHPFVCAESGTVKTILSINYRDATILLENGNTVTVNQSTLKPGDTFCVKFIRSE